MSLPPANVRDKRQQYLVSKFQESTAGQKKPRLRTPESYSFLFTFDQIGECAKPIESLNQSRLVLRQGLEFSTVPINYSTTFVCFEDGKCVKLDLCAIR